MRIPLFPQINEGAFGGAFEGAFGGASKKLEVKLVELIDVVADYIGFGIPQ